METKAKHLLVGSFVIVSLLGLLFFIAWLLQTNTDNIFVRYQSYFNGSVAGLELGSDVRYRGIKAGRVTAITIHPADPGKVSVTMSINGVFLLRKGDVASIKSQGLTGIAYVNIQGATPDNHYLYGKEPEPIEIPTEESDVEKLFTSVPEMMLKALQSLEQINQLISTENIGKINIVLTNLEGFSNSLNQSGQQLGKTLLAINHSLRQIDSAANSVTDAADSADAFFDNGQQTLISANRLLDKDVPEVARSLKVSVDQFGQLSDELKQMLAENRPPIRAFTSDTLAGFSLFVDDARLLVIQLDRLIEQLQSDGAQFLITGDNDGFTELK